MLSIYPQIILQFVNFFNKLWINKVIMDLQHTEITYAVTVKGVKICPYSDILLQIQQFLYSISLALSDDMTVTPSGLEFSILFKIQFPVTFHVLQP